MHTHTRAHTPTRARVGRQVNTTAAETLYSSIGDLIDADPARTTLVDVCCGTGSIGLTLANRSGDYA